MSIQYIDVYQIEILYRNYPHLALVDPTFFAGFSKYLIVKEALVLIKPRIQYRFFMMYHIMIM
jgi:hypothetical protein